MWSNPLLVDLLQHLVYKHAPYRTGICDKWTAGVPGSARHKICANQLVRTGSVEFGQSTTVYLWRRAAQWRRSGGAVAAQRRRSGGAVAAQRRRSGGAVASFYYWSRGSPIQ
jgi:hypothetical protein